MSIQKIHLIRTFLSVGMGGPVPPLELLYITSTFNQKPSSSFDFKVTDTGVNTLNETEVAQEIIDFNAEIVVLYAMAWEAEYMHTIANIVKEQNSQAKIIVFGQLASLASKYICEDSNIDYVVVGEPEETVFALVQALKNNQDCAAIEGLVFLKKGKLITTPKRVLSDNIDDIQIDRESWRLIDVKEYAQYANWNGSLKEDFYIPILTSRGCPFPCAFCLETYDKKFRARSPQSVVEEIKFLQKEYGVKEIHIFDAIFNYDNKRALDICQAIIDENLNISLAFPHGIRADIMTPELIQMLKKAGTYKLVYGIESGSERIQKRIKKNLNLQQVHNVIKDTAKAGIITGGYFILGFDSESEKEIEETINFAADSDLDTAAFFKSTDYNDVIELYKTQTLYEGSKQTSSFEDIAYFAKNRSKEGMPAATLNKLILKAQGKFYLSFKRLFRGIVKYPHKFKYVANIFTAISLMLQAYLMQELTPKKVES